uniref:Anaphase-promoting complex subunit 4-like WD40 domain-containing protein n=1 Tax=Chromera velia CCMP2878 TaxID=1169474 RepID=A0A0G4EYL7_9ALVE|eukprot:Cvel_14299.t1-p1 / transcript=Cvel_14299.t1 / gene=Cvel_14299 / organism=Chromera_velia_CCMP2878 / gene_product=Eukaryotic translation initiation factor 3 subunit, putative / transcript_product=Eukaryotic translation initiation factor 3 subunit, putative / location=Cvel_scaffold1010:42073-44610(-) / protein_length=501 / sequence_SO=supercontig / SO=protein_coding / is_pseudo=false
MGNALGRSDKHYLKGHTGSLVWLDVSPHGNFIVTAGDVTVRLWNVETCKTERVWKHTSAVEYVAFAPEGTRIVCGAVGGAVYVYDLKIGFGSIVACWKAHNHPGAPSVHFFVHRLFVITAQGHSVRIWSLKNQPHANQQAEPTPAPPGSGSGATQGPQVNTVEDYHLNVPSLLNEWWTAKITVAKPSHNFVLLACATQTGMVSIHRLPDGHCHQVLRAIPDGTPVQALAWTPCCQILATGGADGIIRLWDARSTTIGGDPWRCVRELGGGGGHLSWVTSCRFFEGYGGRLHPRGHSGGSSSSSSGSGGEVRGGRENRGGHRDHQMHTVSRVDWEKGGDGASLGSVAGGQHQPQSLSSSSSTHSGGAGRLSGGGRDLREGEDSELPLALVSAGLDGVVKLWDVFRGEVIQHYGSKEVPLTVTFPGGGGDGGGQSGAVGGGSGPREPGTTGSTSVVVGSDPVFACALSADGRMTLSGGRDGSLRLWRVMEGAIATPATTSTNK